MAEGPNEVNQAGGREPDNHDGVGNDDARGLAVEIIATLVNIKKASAEQILAKAGVPAPLIRRFLTERHPSTGEKRSKREGAIMVLDELAQKGADAPVVRQLIANAAEWTSFHLAAEPYRARAAVQRAREMVGTLADVEEREQALHEQRTRAAEDRRKKDAATVFRLESRLLLSMLDDTSDNADPHRRGYLLQDLLNRTFLIHGFPVRRSFQRNGGGEQIDGAFELDGWQYLVECRWRSKMADIRDLDGLHGQVSRAGRQTMGLYLAINGWSENVPNLLRQNPDKSILLMEGYDLRSVLAQHADLKTLMRAKVRALNLDADPFFAVSRLPGFGR